MVISGHGVMTMCDCRAAGLCVQRTGGLGVVGSWGCIQQGLQQPWWCGGCAVQGDNSYGFALVSLLGKALCVTVFMRVCEHRALEMACFGVCGKLERREGGAHGCVCTCL